MRIIQLHQKEQNKNNRHNIRRGGVGNGEPLQIVGKNFPNLWKELCPRIQKAKRTPNYHNPKGLCPRHIVLC